MIGKTKKSLSNRKGFTLIELIVVIAIIAILAAVLIPRFTGFTESGRQKSAISDARNVLVAMEALIEQGQTGITQSDVYTYAGKTFSGAITWGTADTDTFYYAVPIGGKTYTVAVNAGVIDMDFSDATPASPALHSSVS